MQPERIGERRGPPDVLRHRVLGATDLSSLRRFAEAHEIGVARRVIAEGHTGPPHFADFLPRQVQPRARGRGPAIQTRPGANLTQERVDSGGLITRARPLQDGGDGRVLPAVEQRFC